MEKIKPIKKFLSFVGGVSGTNLRIIEKSAYISGDQLSGILEGKLFKITINDDDTIYFNEIDTNSTDIELKKRLIEDMCTAGVKKYFNKFVLPFAFKTESGDVCYLEIEHETPFNKLKSLFGS